MNFGLPGGLGVTTLVKYAKVTYGVELSAEDATKFRDKLINEVYPELRTYLNEDSWSVVARQLQCDIQQVRELFPRPEYLGATRRILSGLTVKSRSRNRARTNGSNRSGQHWMS